MAIHTPTDDGEIIYQHACMLFDALWNQTPIRLLGIRTTKLTDADEPVQMNLFDIDMKEIEKSQKQKKLENALGKVRGKYGADIIRKGL